MATLYTVRTTAGVLHAELTLDEAAPMLGVDPLELEWSIEEDGICSTIDDQGKDITAVAVGDEWRLCITETRAARRWGRRVRHQRVTEPPSACSRRYALG
jgi:hypothetical protein